MEIGEPLSVGCAQPLTQLGKGAAVSSTKRPIGKYIDLGPLTCDSHRQHDHRYSHIATSNTNAGQIASSAKDKVHSGRSIRRLELHCCDQCSARMGADVSLKER